MWSSHRSYGCGATYITCIMMHDSRCRGVPPALGYLVSRYSSNTIRCILTNINVHNSRIDIVNRSFISIPPEVMKIPIGYFHDGTVKRVSNIKTILLEEVE